MSYARRYAEDGFFSVGGILSLEEVAALRAELVAIVRGSAGGVIGAVDDPSRPDEELMADTLAVHHPHKLSELVLDTMRHPSIVAILTEIIGANVKAMQTMMFVKKAGKPGQAWHQDEFFIATRDRSLCGVWIALDDATIENGCLWVQPGSHRPGVLYRTEKHSDARFDTAPEAQDYPFDREGGEPIELKAGGVAFFNGYLLHRSLPNRASQGFRRALVIHYMSAHSLLPWTMGAPAAPEDVRDIVMIAGQDPYAWKGIQPASLPYVRPDNPERAATIFSRLQQERAKLNA